MTALFGATVRRAAVSGRVRALAVSDDGTRAYAATAGGLWYTRNGGVSWAPLDAAASSRFDGELHAARALAVSALSVQFGANEAADQIVAGTGDPSLESVLGPDGGRGIGVRSAVGPAAAAAPAWTREAANLTGAVIFALVHENANVVWAAVSDGLYRRPVAAADRNAWERVLPGLFWDVVITPAEGAEPLRVWAASDGKLQWTANGADFTDVALPDNFPIGDAGRAAIGRIRLAAGRRAAPVWALASGARLWRVTPAGTSPVDGVPDDLSGPRQNDRADFALAIGCVPTEPDEIIIAGGATRIATPEPAASVYRARVRQRGGRWTFPGGTEFETRVPPPLIGIGVPAGVHAMVVQPPPTRPPAAPPQQIPQTIWLATDAGVFRSRNGGGSFVACNAGLPTFEAEHLADHVRTEGLLFVGANSAGALRADALEAWTTALRAGGGGVVIDPADGRRIAAQRRGAAWHLSVDGRTFAPITWFNLPGGVPPALAPAYSAANTEENQRSADASTPAAIVAPNGSTQLAIGTRRVWYSEDWGRVWRTLPTVDQDPSAVDGAGRGPRTDQDLSDGEVLVLRWGTADLLYALTTNAVYLYRRVLGAGGAPPTWTRITLYHGPALKPKKRKLRGTQIPPEMPRTNLAVHRTDRAPNGSLYVTTSRSFEDDDERHVWWFDGNNRWIECGLNVSAPAYALAVDPSNPDRVYVGTAVGIYRGVLQLAANPADDPTWAWTSLTAGLPEAPCVALTVHAGARVLRAAISGRGVFEIPIEGAVAEPAAAVFLRAHEYDMRRTAIPADARSPIPAVGAVRPFAALSYESLRLDASPDICVRRAPGTPPPAFASYVSRFTAGASEPRTFEALAIQAALRRGGDAVVPVTGIDDASFRPAVERALHREEPNAAAAWNEATAFGQLGNIYPLDAAVIGNTANAIGTRTTLNTAGVPFQGRDLVGRVLRFGNDVREPGNRGVSTLITAHGDNSLTFLALPAPVAVNDAFDIFEETPGTSAAAWATLPPPDPDGISSCVTSAGRTLVDVTVHTRATPITAGRVAVVLLRGQFAGLAAAPPVSGLPADWANRLRVDQALPAANRGAWLPADWTYFDDATRQILDIGHAFDARSPAVVTFSAILPAGQWLLCAVALALDDIVNAGTGDMFTVVRERRQVALRSVHALAEPALKKHAFYEWHQDSTLLPYNTPAGSPSDARLIVEDENGNLRPKKRLHLCFLEHAVAAFEVTLPAGGWRASWSIEDSRGNVVATHPGFPIAAPSNIVNGSYAWKWDGRSDPAVGLAAGLRGRFVLEGMYRSHLTIVPNPPVPGVRFEYFAEIRAEGRPYHIFVEGVPKNDEEMKQLIANNIGAAGDPFNRANGQRIPQDIWIVAYRGRIDDGHCVFLGRGIMEATDTDAGPNFGAPATPKDREYKAWLRTQNLGYDRCQLEDLGIAGTNSLLLNMTDGVPSNPYFTAEPGLPSPQSRKNFVQAHAGNLIWTTDDLTAGCTAVSPNDATEPAAARRLSMRGLLRSIESSFGGLNAPAAGPPIIPEFRNKQRKRTAPAPNTALWSRRDALLDDGHAQPELAPAPFAAGASVEPLHMQDTLQSAGFGGFQVNEVPLMGVATEPALDGNNAPRLRLRCVLRDYRRGSAYHIYHHAVIVKHEARLVGGNYEIVFWIPRKVIRGWNSASPNEDHSGRFRAVPADRRLHDPLPENRRNVRTTGNIGIRWFIRHTSPAGVVVQVGADIVGGPGPVYAAPPQVCRNVHNLAAPVAAGLYESVCEYQLQMRPHGAAERWHRELAVIDVLSNNRARLAEEQEFVDGAGNVFFRGSSIVEIVRVP